MSNLVSSFDNQLYELDDCKNIQAIVKSLHNQNDFSSNLEGNVMFKHFTYDKDEERQDIRNNLWKCSKFSKKAIEIGFNAGHSSLIMLNANPSLEIVCYDNCFHQYTKPCAEYLASKYNLKLVDGDSRMTTFIMNRDNKYDLIHIDGGHSKELAFKDIINCRYVAHDKTLLILDDANYTQITEIIDFLITCAIITEVNYVNLGLIPAKYHRIFNYKL